MTDEVKRLSSIKLEAKLKSTTLLLGTTGELRVGVTLANNTVELHSLRISEGHEGKFACIPIFFSENSSVSKCKAKLLFQLSNLYKSNF